MLQDDATKIYYETIEFNYFTVTIPMSYGLPEVTNTLTAVFPDLIHDTGFDLTTSFSTLDNVATDLFVIKITDLI